MKKPHNAIIYKAKTINTIVCNLAFVFSNIGNKNEPTVKAVIIYTDKR